MQPQKTISDVQANRALTRRLARCTDLPSPSGIAIRIIDLCQNPETTMMEVAEVLGHDPALSAKLLRMANSALYARHRRTENIRQAISLFGLNGTLTLSLGFSLVGGERRKIAKGIDHNRFWRRSLAVAVGSQIIGEHLQVGAREELFLAGLLQDIGMLALEKAYPDLYRGMAGRHPPHRQIIEIEESRLQTDHAAIGAWLLRQWRLSENLVEAVARSHWATEKQPESAVSFNDIVAAASDLADIWWQDEPHDALQAWHRIANAPLNLSPDTAKLIVAETANLMTETTALFDIDCDDTVESDLLLQQARELSALRNLRDLQESRVMREKAESLVAHAQELEEAVRRDNLTGLYNRNHLEEILQGECRLAVQNSFPLTVAFIDLDHFKSVNDRFGHQAGDAVLVHCARLLLQNTRHSDIVARYGGEEFVAVLPGTNHAGAQRVCERMLSSLRDTPCTLSDENTITVTASIGVVIFENDNEIHNVYDLLRAADRALYVAKSSGRDRIVYSESRQDGLPPSHTGA